MRAKVEFRSDLFPANAGEEETRDVRWWNEAYQPR